MSRVAVIGGGISGIATAYYLNKAGIPVDLYEAAPAIGGRIGSERMDGRWVDFGGKNIGRKYRRFRGFVRDTGDFPFEYFGFNTSQVIDGKVVSMTKESRQLSNLFGFLKLAGLRGVSVLYPWVRAVMKDNSQGMLRTPFFNDVSQKLDHLSLADCFPPRCANHLIRPVTVRMNGAEPDECYPGNFGSNLALVLDSYEQLKGGMHQLLEAFAADRSGLLAIRTGHRVERLSRCDRGGGVDVAYTCNGSGGSVSYDRVITALPAVQLSALLGGSLPEAAEILDRVRYYPVSVAIAAYRDNVFRKEQRAMVFDGTSPLSNAGAYGILDLDLVRYTFSGKAARAQINPESKAEDVIFQAEKKVLPFFSIAENIRTSMIYKYLSPGLCAYSPFHFRLFSELQDKLASFSGLYVTGDFRRGASIEACFAAAEESVKHLMTGELF
ncbi:MAG: FAD-dependent oxidoreductase [Chlorobium sp.]|uniref:protoporphyrinogen/coproporphyrinogen oxidase n=1 Tax=Chlorobium sp. TaxID=1095 RepID=UPI0025BB489C|nr:FAD-dependent oxidoreductase [Chlorobium sp.]MCF8382754.1 FAD-dependent oxidoreductase [Chlorobium sp.]